MPRVTYRLHEPNGRSFSVTGSGLTRADAVAEANAKLALTIGDIDSSSVSDILAAGELGTVNAGTDYSDAEFIMRNGSGKTVTVHLENIANGLGDGVTGDLDLTAGLLIAFATAYRDGDGGGGYIPYGGKFVK